jgi:BlaI family penicillinase repressor
MSKLVSKITDSELEVMHVLWEAGCELPIADIRKTLEQTSKWEASTIKTLLRRLCQKGVVSATKKEVFYYKPLVSEEEYNEYATQSLIDRLYAGSAKNLVASLLGSKKLDKSDIEELRTMFKVGDREVTGRKSGNRGVEAKKFIEAGEAGDRNE